MELSTFTFNGVSCGEFGLRYAPDIRDMYVWRPTTSNIHSQTFDGHHGGYFYGATKKPKEIVLRMFFEESKITEGILSQVESFYRVGATGKLVLGRRPWVYYNATITSYDDTQLTNKFNGMITIRMQCFYPFGRCEFLNLDQNDPYYDDIVANSNMFVNMTGAFPIEYTNLTAETQLHVMNPGNETADVALEIAGDVGQGVLIENRTTGQTCKIVAMSAAETTQAGKYYVCDSLNGYCYLTNGTDKEMKYLWHDRGFVQISPAKTLASNLHGQLIIDMQTDQLGLEIDKPLSNDVIGKYAVVQNKPYKITRLENNSIYLRGFIGEGVITSYDNIRIVDTDDIWITPITTMSIDRLKFVYSPTFM